MDNLKQISEKVNTDIDPNGAPESILAQNHNDILQTFLRASGKYANLPYMIRGSWNNVVTPGTIYFNGALNATVVGFVSLLSSDNVPMDEIFNIYQIGDIFHIKDFEGRSSYFTISNIIPQNDSVGTPYMMFVLEPFASNSNHVYQQADPMIGVIEFIKKVFAETTPSDPFKNVELKMFWGMSGKDTNPLNATAIKQLSRQKFIGIVGPDKLYRTISQCYSYLFGYEIEGFDQIQDLEPVLIIERFKKKKRNSTSTQSFDTYFPSKYRSQIRFENTILISQGIDTGLNVTRPQKFELTSNKNYIDIYLENYFSISDSPNAMGNNMFKTFPKQTALIKDNSETITRSIPLLQKGYQYFQVRLGVTKDGQFILSKPMGRFKGISQMSVKTDVNPNELICVYKFAHV